MIEIGQDEEKQMTWTVSEISKMMGIPIDSLRYYDRLGLISPKRKRNKYRLYDDRDLVLLQYVAVMKYACFSLSEIKSVLESALEQPSEECSQRNVNILKCKRAELLSKISNYKIIIKLIDATIPLVESDSEYKEKEKILDDYIHEIFEKIKNRYLG